MKKLLFAFIFILIVAFLPVKGEIIGAKKTEIYYGGAFSGAASIVCGEKNFVPFSAFLIKRGESAEFKKNEFDELKFSKNYDLCEVGIEYCNDVEIHYYTYKNAKYTEEVNGKKVNMAIAFSNELITVGVPIIYGSF